MESFLVFLVSLVVLAVDASPQSNYADRGLDVEYQGNGLPLEATLDGVVTQLDDLTHTIHTNRTTASLSCASRAMEVDLEFTEPFYGIVYADVSRTSACSLQGEGLTKYHFELPLAGCGTLQDPLRVFTNNIIVRFHPSLELERDEIKTIVCRYPEPIVPPPLNPPLPVSLADTPVLPAEQLSEMPILLIICCLLFLAMMLFGVTFSYFCLKHRNVRLVRHTQLMSSGAGSAITKMSDNTIFPPMFEGLKIPRAHACPSNSGSEQLIVGTPVEHSDTLPSDYPSESRSCSEMEECDIRCGPSVSSGGRPAAEGAQLVNQPYLPDDDVDDECLSSVYSDAHAAFDVDVFGLPMVIPRVDPCFDVAFHVRQRSPAPSSATSVTSVESDVSRAQLLQCQERALTTILEREEWRTNEITRLQQAKLQPGELLHPPADCADAPPVDYAQVVRKPRSTLSQRSIPENETWSVTEHEEVAPGRMPLSPARSLASVNTEMTDPHSIGEIIMQSSRPVEAPRPQVSFLVKAEPPQKKMALVVDEDIQLHTSIQRLVTDEDEKETMIVPTPERPVPPPKMTTQEVDDVYLKTITETRIMEENERIRRKMTEYHQRPRPLKQQAPLPPNWDVTIRQHPPAPQSHAPSESTNWDDASTIDPANPQWDVSIRQYPPAPYEPRTPSESTVWDEMSQVEPNLPPDWDVKIRQYPPVYEPRTPSESTNWDGQSQVEPEARPEWDVQIRQHPPAYEPRSPSESTVWDGQSQAEPEVHPEWDVKIRQHPPLYEPRSPSESTVWDGQSQAEPEVHPEWDVKIRQHPPLYEPRTPSESTVWDGQSQAEPEVHPEWDVKIRQHPPAYEPRSPSESTVWDGQSQAEPEARPEWDVKIRKHPPVYEPRSPSESTVWDGQSQAEPEARPEWDVKIRKHPPVYEPRSPSDSTNWGGASTVTDLPEVEAPPPDWDVKIRQYPPVYPPRTPSDSTNWDATSNITDLPEVVGAAPPDWDVKIRQYPPVYPPREPSEYTDWDGASQTDSQHPAAPPLPAQPEWDVSIRQYPPAPAPARTLSDVTDWSDAGSEQPQRSIFQLDHRMESASSIRRTTNWDVLIRVLNPAPEESSDTASVLTEEDRERWREIITTESTLRTLLTEAVVTEDFERIRRDTRYTRMFEPIKWDVIIRVLAHPPHPQNTDDTSDTQSETTVNSSEPPIRRFHRRPDVDSRSHRSSLTPVLESSHPPGIDVRSITETTVDQTWNYDPEGWNESRNYPEEWDDESDRMSRPSLARSTSEFTDYPTQRLPYDRVSEYSSASSARRSRSARERGDIADGSDRSSGSISPPLSSRRGRVPYERVNSSSGSDAGMHPQ